MYIPEFIVGMFAGAALMLVVLAALALWSDGKKKNKNAPAVLGAPRSAATTNQTSLCGNYLTIFFREWQERMFGIWRKLWKIRDLGM